MQPLKSDTNNPAFNFTDNFDEKGLVKVGAADFYLFQSLKLWKR
jgi:hypothetical protein